MRGHLSGRLRVVDHEGHLRNAEERLNNRAGGLDRRKMRPHRDFCSVPFEADRKAVLNMFERFPCP